MIAIGIPTYNEAKNISKLTQLIDCVAVKIGLEIVIINADNNSPDNTATIFTSVKTLNKKISVVTKEVGKGFNIKAIIDIVNNLDNCEGCILIDGDITSFSESWLKKFIELLIDKVDFVVPNYSRSFQEGNTTNHFVYPLINYHTNGNCPRQPIAGDFGLSKNFIKFLVNSVHWHKYCYGYGIDIFLTLHAVYNNFRIEEINLDRKEHNPSFGKMVDMFVEVASSYYETSKIIFESKKKNGIFNTAVIKSSNPSVLFSPKIFLSPEEILKKKEEANKILASKETILNMRKDIEINPSVWVEILLAHEKRIGQVDSQLLAKSILPYYLLRVVDYLQNISNVKDAELNIEKEIDLLQLQKNEAVKSDVEFDVDFINSI
ncbi:glycosyltransferase [Bacillus thuringiensis]|nr:glycosyltransferase [Bacillus thuringiensis]